VDTIAPLDWLEYGLQNGGTVVDGQIETIEQQPEQQQAEQQIPDKTWVEDPVTMSHNRISGSSVAVAIKSCDVAVGESAIERTLFFNTNEHAC
jgi:hypothetical protein